MEERKRIAIRTAARWTLSAAYLAAGVLHLSLPGPFAAITPGWVPHPGLVIALTGVAELAGAAGLMVPQTRQVAAWGLALYAVCVFPANIQHAMLDLALPHPVLGWAYHAPRLALQPGLVWWALWAGEVLDWPFRRKGT